MNTACVRSDEQRRDIHNEGRTGADTSAGDWMAPVRKPRPSGEYASTAMPSLRHVGSTSSSMERSQTLYSTSTAVSGQMECASLICAADASDKPTARILPAATSSFSAPIVSSRGTLVCMRHTMNRSMYDVPRRASAASHAACTASARRSGVNSGSLMPNLVAMQYDSRGRPLKARASSSSPPV